MTLTRGLLSLTLLALCWGLSTTGAEGEPDHPHPFSLPGHRTQSPSLPSSPPSLLSPDFPCRPPFPPPTLPLLLLWPPVKTLSGCEASLSTFPSVAFQTSNLLAGHSSPLSDLAFPPDTQHLEVLTSSHLCTFAPGDPQPGCGGVSLLLPQGPAEMPPSPRAPQATDHPLQGLPENSAPLITLGTTLHFPSIRPSGA